MQMNDEYNEDIFSRANLSPFQKELQLLTILSKEISCWVMSLQIAVEIVYL